MNESQTQRNHPEASGPAGRTASAFALFALLVVLIGVAGVAPASEPLTPSLEQRRTSAEFQYSYKQRPTVDSLVIAWTSNKIVAKGNKGGPLNLEKLPQGVRFRLERQLRFFARGIMPVERLPTRSIIQELVADPELAKTADFDFDPQSGEIELRMKEELWRATLRFNAYQLGHAIRTTGRYGLGRAEALEP